MDLTAQERGAEMLRGETLIHVPVELWVGDGQAQGTLEKQTNQAITVRRALPL